MRSSKFKALWDFVFLSGGEMIGKVAGMVAFAYMARTLGPNAYGSVEVALALLGFFTLFVSFGLGPIGAREVSRNRESVNIYARLIPGSRLLLTLICMPAMWLVSLVMGKSPETTELIFVTAFALLATVWNQNWLFQGLEKMRLVSFNQALRMWFYAICVILFVKGSGDLIRVGYIEVAAAAVSAIYFLLLQKRVQIAIGISLNMHQSFKLMKRAFAVGSSNIVWALNQYLPTLMVAYFIGGSATAWLGAAHRIVNAITTFSMVYHFNLFPAVTHRLRHSKQAFAAIVGPSFRVTAWATIGIALSISLLSETISIFIFGKDFVSAGLPMSILIWSLPLTMLSGHARWALIAKEKQQYVLYAQLAGTATTLLLGVVLISMYGLVGGAIAMVSCSAVVWLIAHIKAVQWVAPIPSLDLAWRPMLLAATVMVILNRLDMDSLPLRVAGIFVFALIAPILDKRLIKDIHNLSLIKNDTKYDTAK